MQVIQVFQFTTFWLTDFFRFNLGTGRGYSVLEMIAAFERVTGHLCLIAL